jgi:hypothetical protein
LDERQPTPAPCAPGEQPRTARGRSIAFQAAALLLTAVSALAGVGMARWFRSAALVDGDAGKPGVKFPNRLFAGWPKPDLVIVLSAQQKGYLLPCGCSHPQIGGLERRYNLLQKIKQAGWPYVAADLGDAAQRHGPAKLPNQQGPLKYFYTMKALKEMDYTAVTFGEYEVNLGLTGLLAEYFLNEPKPRMVSSNLMEADKNYPEQVFTWALADQANNPSGIKVGVTAVTSPTTAARIKALTNGDKKLRFEQTTAALNRVLPEMNGKVDLRVLLYQGPIQRDKLNKKQLTDGEACAAAYPQFPIVLCLSDEDDPPSRPVKVKTKTDSESLVITLGRKGRFVGVVGVFKTGNAKKPYDFRYERVEMTEDFMTPDGQEKGHPIVELMEAYTRELRDRKFLERYGQMRHALQVMPAVPNLKNPGKAEYLGSAACKKCHQEVYDIWEKTPHSHAYKTLVDDAKRPSNRQYDPECIVCHTVGFGYQTGYVNEQRTPLLKNVGCESCHGPSSLHAANPHNREWKKRINPWKYLPESKRKDAMDQTCQKCHDIDNDVTWIHGAFEKKWPKVEHKTPKSEANGEEK